ncbi:sexual stage-specific protein kinase [Cryptosporidium canis]|uniref:Sexual stage-specific protein kinase n=1 Tax=Cryptosporidium canis TaxID=195482 RepID=A0A9D5HX57_9CRYT|nr:sexual stage-specific protein kinase [Cryptosporidium canis]
MYRSSDECQEVYKKVLRGQPTAGCLKTRGLIVFNSGGIELLDWTYGIHATKTKSKTKHSICKTSERNIIISAENLDYLPYINGRGVFFYYGETLENQRHGWGFLADQNKIVYEGMWYMDQAVGLYILQCGFTVEFGYNDYFSRETNSYRSQIYSSKETEIILDIKFRHLGLRNECICHCNWNETGISSTGRRSCSLSDLKHLEKLMTDSIAFVDRLKGSCLDLTQPENYGANSGGTNCQITHHPRVPFVSKNPPCGLSTVRQYDVINPGKDVQFWSSEYFSPQDNKARLPIRADQMLGRGSQLSFRKLESGGVSPTPIYACECIKWSHEILSHILISNGLLEEAMIFQSNKIAGRDIPNINDQYIEQLGVTDNYSRKFISRLLNQFWEFLDYMDLSLTENASIRDSSTLPFIHFSQIKLESYISGNSHTAVFCAGYKGMKVICKTLLFNVENYEELASFDKLKLANTANNILEYTFDECIPRHEHRDLENTQYSPACYVYKFRKDPVSEENMSKYIPTPVKMRNWEGRVLRYLGPHPNIVECIGATQLFMGYEALLLENCEGGSMDQYLFKGDETEFQKLRSRFSASRLDMLSWLRDIAAGMHHVHQSGVLHRDLKLSNFFVSRVMGESTGKVGDFGIAIAIDPRLGYSPLTDFGNVYYAAPEVLRKEGFFKESDVWSFGICMLEVLTKSLVFDGFCPGLAMVVNAADITPPHKGLHAPPDLKKLLESILHPDRGMRPSFDVISCELSRIIESSQMLALEQLFEFHAFG